MADIRDGNTIDTIWIAYILTPKFKLPDVGQLQRDRATKIKRVA
jgi:hypothetical protein